MEQEKGIKPGYTDFAVWDQVVAKIKAGNEQVVIDYNRSKQPGVMTIEASIFDCFHPIGTLYYRVQAGNTVSIEYLIVVDKMRGAGIGKKLVEALLDYAFNNLKALAVLTSRVNEHSEKVLTPLGFGWDETTDCWAVTKEEYENR